MRVCEREREDGVQRGERSYAHGAKSVLFHDTSVRARTQVSSGCSGICGAARPNRERGRCAARRTEPTSLIASPRQEATFFLLKRFEKGCGTVGCSSLLKRWFEVTNGLSSGDPKKSCTVRAAATAPLLYPNVVKINEGVLGASGTSSTLTVQTVCAEQCWRAPKTAKGSQAPFSVAVAIRLEGHRYVYAPHTL